MRYLAAKIIGTLAISVEALPRLDLVVLGAILLAPQQSVALGQAGRRLLAKPLAAVPHRVIVACDQRQVSLPQTLDVISAVSVVRTELGPVPVSKTLRRQGVHVTPVDIAQKRRHSCDLVLWQQSAALHGE